MANWGWNPNRTNSSISIFGSGGRLAVKESNNGIWNTTIAYPSASYPDKFYFEIVAASAADTNFILGLANENSAIDSGTAYPGSDTNSWGIRGQSGDIYHRGTFTDYGDAYTVGDVIGIAVSASKMWFSKNGVWQGAAGTGPGQGDPETGVNPAFGGSHFSNSDIFGGRLNPAAGLYVVGNGVQLNAQSQTLVYSRPTGYATLLGELNEITPVAGLYLTPDPTPLSSTLNTNGTLLIDGDTFTVADPSNDFWWGNVANGQFSYGVDIGSPQAVKSLVFHCVYSTGFNLDTWGVNGRFFNVYYSNDNSTWTEIGYYTAPPIISHEAGRTAFLIAFPTPVTARYFKARAYSPVSTVAFSTVSVKISEIVVNAANDVTSSSSSSFSSSSESSSSVSSSSSESSSSLSSSSSTSSSSKSSSSTVTSERIHFWHYVLNEGGQPIQNAEIRLYLQSSPTTEAEIYTSPIAVTSTTCSLADIKTDNDGYFEFWLEGEGGEGGYAHATEFILEWYKAGTAPGYIYNYNPWPNALVWRDKNIGADVNYENKFISNYLAEKWFGHANAIVPSASPHDLHPVDYQSGCDDNTYNKVVSNKFIYDIQVGAADGETFNLTSIYDGVQEHQKVVSAGNLIVSGSLYYKDINHVGVTGDTVVKMVKIDGYEEIIPAVVQRLSSTSTRVAIDISAGYTDVWVTIQGSA